MQPHNVYLEALDQVLATDLPEEAYAQALTDQAAHIAGVETDELGVTYLD